jgi:tRNA A-37 threonylcarbamoyl transferase component Bud32
MSPLLAFLGIGGMEVIVLLAFLFLVIALVAFLILRSRQSSNGEPRETPRHRSARTVTQHSVMRQCPECGKDLPGDAPEGLCPQCLLKGVISSAHDASQLASESTAAYADSSTAPTVEELAPLFPHLEILELIGQGGMGAVYKARQPSLDRLVAVKVLPPAAGRDPSFAERFGREARALAHLSHPNIVAVHDIGKANELYYFVMEYVDGVNLRQILRDGKLTPAQALRIVPQICDALQYAHEEGVVHRDIKPENILLDRKGRVKIADFGLAKLMGRDAGNFTLTGSQQVMGTLYYMAPEQVDRPLEVDHRADIYSLGVVFYEMLTGQLPVGRYPMPSEKAGTDAFLDEVVLHALEREPAQRYQHASEVKTDVESGSRPVALPRKKADLPTAASRVRGPALALLLVGILQSILPFLLLCMGLLLLGFPVGNHGVGAQSSDGALASAGWSDHGGPLFAQPVLAAGESPIWIVILPLTLLMGAFVGLVIIGGSVSMMRLRSHGWATAAATLALLPCGPAWLIGLPAGIWALWVLNTQEVKAAFHS